MNPRPKVGFVPINRPGLYTASTETGDT
jgi:hypothetical protein